MTSNSSPENTSTAAPASPDSAPAGDSPKEKAAPKAKATAKAKAPKVEDKPFAEFIQQDYLPALEQALSDHNIFDFTLTFENNQVTGRWLDGRRQFTVYFPQGDIKRQRAFSWSFNGMAPRDD